MEDPKTWEEFKDQELAMLRGELARKQDTESVQVTTECIAILDRAKTETEIEAAFVAVNDLLKADTARIKAATSGACAWSSTLPKLRRNSHDAKGRRHDRSLGQRR